MSAYLNAFSPLPGFAGARTYAAWPVWSDSTTKEVKFQGISKKLANRYYQKARAFNRSKTAGRYGGALGSAALRVLESLIFDFLNFNSGRCDPSYEAIARKTGLGRSTVAVALARLKELRLLNWLRRCAEQWEDGRFMLRQDTNAYAVLPPSHWLGYADPDAEPPAPHPSAWGATPPLPSVIEQAIEVAAERPSLARLAGILESDPRDELANSLASLGRSMAARAGNS